MSVLSTLINLIFASFLVLFLPVHSSKYSPNRNDKERETLTDLTCTKESLLQCRPLLRSEAFTFPITSSSHPYLPLVKVVGCHRVVSELNVVVILRKFKFL